MHRYEILLPLRHNDGSPVPDPIIAAVVIRLREKFGAVSVETQQIRGIWEHQGAIYRDELARVFVDVSDSLEIRGWFREFKEQLKTDFRQVDIWIVAHPIEVI